MRLKAVLRPFGLALGVLALGAAVPAGAAEAGRTYKFSPVNQFGVELTASYWNPIIQYVSARSGVTLELKIGRTSADTTSYVLAREVEFAFTNHLFNENRRRMGWKLLARRDYPAVRGQILTTAESAVTDLRQLADQEVAFPGKEAFVAYKVTYAHLMQEQVPVKVVFGGNHDGAFAQLLSGKVKAVGVNSQLAEAYALREKKQFRVLWSSGEFNDLALMASPAVPEADAKAVADAVLGMGNDPEGKAIIQRVSEMAKIPPFQQWIPAPEEDYTPYMDFYRAAPASLQ